MDSEKDDLKKSLDELFDEEFDNYKDKIKEEKKEELTQDTNDDFLSYGSLYKKDSIFFRRKILVAILTLFIVMTIGQSFFNEKIIINGTANVKGEIKIESTCNVISGGVDIRNGNCSVDGTKIYTESLLVLPTDNITYMIVMKNTGTMPIVLKKIMSPNNKNEYYKNGDVLYLDQSTFLSGTYLLYYNENELKGDSNVISNNITLNPDESIVIIIKHEWLSNENIVDKQPEVNNTGSKINYDMVLEFGQITI